MLGVCQRRAKIGTRVRDHELGEIPVRLIVNENVTGSVIQELRRRGKVTSWTSSCYSIVHTSTAGPK